MTEPAARPDALQIARRFVEEARAGRDTAAARVALAGLDAVALAADLPDDPARIAFWTNVYNGAVRARLIADPAAYARRWSFFTTPAVAVAGQDLSPNAIENGLLRRSALLAGLGYLRNPRPSRFERMLRVHRVDPRIHFALNCGARSCPPLATWEPATLDADLDHATRSYLAVESVRSADGAVLTVPRLLFWYRGDFGGRENVVRLLRRHGIIGPDESPRLRYGPYDWTPDLEGGARTGRRSGADSSDGLAAGEPWAGSRHQGQGTRCQSPRLAAACAAPRSGSRAGPTTPGG